MSRKQEHLREELIAAAHRNFEGHFPSFAVAVLPIVIFRRNLDMLPAGAAAEFGPVHYVSFRSDSPLLGFASK